MVLKEYLEKEYSTFMDNVDEPHITLFGKTECGCYVDENGNAVNEYEWAIAEYIGNGDFSIHHIHSWDRVVEWLNKNTQGYEYYNDLYLQQQRENKEE